MCVKTLTFCEKEVGPERSQPWLSQMLLPAAQGLDTLLSLLLAMLHLLELSLFSAPYTNAC